MLQSNQRTSGFYRFAALGTAVSSIALFAACGESVRQSTEIKTSKPTALGVHLEKCSKDKLSGGMKTVTHPSKKVCRKNAEGQTVSVPLEPRFQIIRGKNKRIAVRQVVAVKFSVAGVSDTEKVAIESRGIEFLKTVCAPKIQAIFQRSGLASSNRFQAFQEGETFSSATDQPQVGARTDSVDDFEPGRSAAEREAKPEPDKKRVVPFPENRRAFTLLMELEASEAMGLRFKDDIAEISSGSLLASTDAAGEEQQLQFCGQVAMRLAENYGLTESRDCEAIAEGMKAIEKAKADALATAKPDAPTKASIKPKAPGADTGLMKLGREAKELKTVKLARKEIHDILVPVCGSLENAANSL